MSGRLLGACALALLLLGCPGAGPAKPAAAALDEASLPTEPEKLLKIADEQHERGAHANVLLALRRAVDKNPEWAASKGGYEAHWRLARACAELCEMEPERKAQHAAAGIEAGRKAVAQEPERPEGSYYLAQNLGFSVQDKKGETKELVAEVVRLVEKAVQIDEKFDHGGPVRMLGALHAKAPPPPLSIGDPEKAVKLLRHAVEIDAAYPANHIYLAGALFADERYSEAEEALKKGRTLLSDPRWERYRPLWSAEADRVDKKLRARQG